MDSRFMAFCFSEIFSSYYYFLSVKNRINKFNVKIMLLFKELFLFLQYNSPNNKTTSAQDLCCNAVIVKSL